VYAIVPGAKYFRAPSTMMYVTMFSVAVFVALGTERVLAREMGKRYAIGWLIAAGVVAILGTSGALTNVARVVASSFDQTGRRDTMVSSNAPDLVFGALRSALFHCARGRAVVGLDARACERARRCVVGRRADGARSLDH
jgi:hypothetical protein